MGKSVLQNTNLGLKAHGKAANYPKCKCGSGKLSITVRITLKKTANSTAKPHSIA